MASFLRLFVVMIVSLALSQSVFGQETPQVPCSDPRGCPDLIVTDVGMMKWYIGYRTFSEDECAVVEGMAVPGERKLRFFEFATPNLGPGDLIIGAPADHPEWFEFETCHGHEHFIDYADYRLWTPKGYKKWKALRKRTDPSVISGDLLAANPQIAAEMIDSGKRGFCVVDVDPAPIVGKNGKYEFVPGPDKYRNCSSNQGISVGWADVYSVRLDGQWVDITDVPPGTYVLEAEVNAEHLYIEEDYTNNSTAIEVLMP